MPVDKYPASKHFTHYAVQFRPYFQDRDTFGTWEHFELAQEEGEPNLLAIYKTEADAEKCRDAIGILEGIEIRIVRYFTGGYIDVKDAPPEAPRSMWFDTPSEGVSPPTQRSARTYQSPRAPSRVKREVEVIDDI